MRIFKWVPVSSPEPTQPTIIKKGSKLKGGKGSSDKENSQGGERSFSQEASSVYTDENTQQSVADSNCSEGSGTINEDSNLSFPQKFSQDADNDSNEADMRLGDSNSSPPAPPDEDSDNPTPSKKTKSVSSDAS